MILPDSHPDAATLADYDARRLPPAEVLAVSDHLAGCAVCREALARLHPAVATTDDPGEPDYEEMAALLDGTLTPERATGVRARLEASPRAEAEFDDLRAFRDASAGRAPVTHGPAAAPRRKIVAFPGWAKFALAAAAAVMLSAGWWRMAYRPPDGVLALATAQTLGSLPAGLRRDVETAVRTGHLDAPPLPPALQGRTGTLAGEASAPGVLTQAAPLGAMVREVRPRLRWTGCPDATSYVVYLGVMGAGEPLFRQELPANRIDWPPPTALARGTVYEWQVEAWRNGEVIDRAPRPPAPESRFEVLGEAEAAALETVERQHAGNALVLGTAYARAGLRAAAAGQFRALAERYPGSAVAARLRCASETNGP